ncbi:DDE superfamily endonuclease [Acidocella aminolytica 101 = DSM 11237]|nr:transposase [Acidocella aminolytica 101 = DSM 11237]SHF63716.1 DDE superfamily endonuclease [Acidocella aminolytica 101 = DSM 11237]
MPRHRSQEFRKFLDEVERNVPANLDIQVVLDNYGTHKTKLIRNWFLKRPRWHVHYTPTSASWNNQVERFNGRIASEVLGINVAGHADLEILLLGFNRAYNGRRQRVLSGGSPIDTVRRHLARNGRLANPHYKPADSNDLLPKVDEILYYANDVSQPDS